MIIGLRSGYAFVDPPHGHFACIALVMHYHNDTCTTKCTALQKTWPTTTHIHNTAHTQKQNTSIYFNLSIVFHHFSTYKIHPIWNAMPQLYGMAQRLWRGLSLWKDLGTSLRSETIRARRCRQPLRASAATSRHHLSPGTSGTKVSRKTVFSILSRNETSLSGSLGEEWWFGAQDLLK